MPKRHETESQRITLERALERECQGGVAQGRMLPPVREIALQHNVSLYVAQQAVRALEARGVLHTISRVGTFVGANANSGAGAEKREPRSEPFEYFALLADGNENGEVWFPPSHAAMCSGFEDGVAARGGAVLLMSTQQVRQGRERGELPALRGVFDLAWSDQGPFWETEFSGSRMPQVRIGGNTRLHGACDTISFNDVTGGAQATQHLLKCGHAHIAFLGLHQENEAEPMLDWSVRREAGWRGALQSANVSGDGLAFHPTRAVNGHETSDQVQASRETCAALLPMLRDGSVTAVVAANDAAALGLLEALRAADVPPARVPAIVGFDADPAAKRHLLTSLRLPWDELGRLAADVLWERAHGELPDAPQHREAAMRLIPRLSCRAQWSLRSGHSTLMSGDTMSGDALTPPLEARESEFLSVTSAAL